MYNCTYCTDLHRTSRRPIECPALYFMTNLQCTYSWGFLWTRLHWHIRCCTHTFRWDTSCDSPLTGHRSIDYGRPEWFCALWTKYNPQKWPCLSKFDFPTWRQPKKKTFEYFEVNNPLVLIIIAFVLELCGDKLDRIRIKEMPFVEH